MAPADAPAACSALAASGAADGSLRLWRLSDGGAAGGAERDGRAAAFAPAAAVTALAFADVSGGAHAADAALPLLSGGADGGVELWAATGGDAAAETDADAGADAHWGAAGAAGCLPLVLRLLLPAPGAPRVTALAAHAGLRRVLVVRARLLRRAPAARGAHAHAAHRPRATLWAGCTCGARRLTRGATGARATLARCAAAVGGTAHATHVALRCVR